MPPGSSLGPVMFNNDIVDIIKYVTPLLFADDALRMTRKIDLTR